MPDAPGNKLRGWSRDAFSHAQHITLTGLLVNARLFEPAFGTIDYFRRCNTFAYR